jgi:hypothetical protein
MTSAAVLWRQPSIIYGELYTADYIRRIIYGEFCSPIRGQRSALLSQFNERGIILFNSGARFDLIRNEGAAYRFGATFDCEVIMTEINSSPDIEADEDRRKFLASCGKFAVVTPPAITLLLSTSLTSDAIAGSSGRSSKGNNGFGNGGRDGSPNGKDDGDR